MDMSYEVLFVVLSMVSVSSSTGYYPQLENWEFENFIYALVRCGTH